MRNTTSPTSTKTAISRSIHRSIDLRSTAGWVSQRSRSSWRCFASRSRVRRNNGESLTVSGSLRGGGRGLASHFLDQGLERHRDLRRFALFIGIGDSADQIGAGLLHGIGLGNRAGR